MSRPKCENRTTQISHIITLNLHSFSGARSLFGDGIYESLRRQLSVQEAVLGAWGICADGHKVMLHMAVGNKESYSDWLDFLRDMARRDLRLVLTTTSDGAPGLLRALDEVFPQSLRIRCWVHKMRNVLGKLPESAPAKVKAWL